MNGALHAEWTKFRTVAGSWWLLLAAAALTIAVSAAAAAAYHCPPGNGACAAAATGADPAKLSLTGVLLGQVIIALIAVLAIGGEYGSGMIRVTLMATPRRLTAYAAKALVTTAAAVAAALLAVGGSVLAGWLILPGKGLSAANGYLPMSLGNAGDLRAACGSVLYLTLIALLAFGVTAALRDSAAGIGAVLGVLLVLPIASLVIPDHVLARHLAQLSPMTAGLYIQVTRGVDTLPLTPWQGLGVTALWAAGALALGAAVLRLRDA
ncbi:ABC transporter permease [Trebonia kvetii]|uniref:ABC transporter permease n=1 Tax=Trebonia kvetii TaxID=2480626 RepID=A0A6P2BP55_9ACTN|nr:ABC transporter permease [Trebonia kvetii]TVZ00782.1 ABC transporter permease [Trebonia kvetii]